MVRYHLYWNGGLAGAPIDYANPIGDTAGLSFQPPPLALDSDNLFGVRAYDDVTGFEEKNVDAVVRILVNADGVDITQRPAPPSNLTAEARANASILVNWAFNRLAVGGKPIGFRIWITPGTVVDYEEEPAADVPHDGSVDQYDTTILGLTDGVAYAIGVKAYNDLGESLPVGPAFVTADGTGPDPVDDLEAVAV